MGAFNNVIASVSGRSFGMGPATNPKVKETRNIPVKMRDGVELLTDLYQPVSDTLLPIFLTRTPYGRRAIGGLLERALAQRGYQVVSQSCRGTFGSGGEFLPFQSDKEDGVDTMKWIAKQPWYSGQVVMWGLSYPGCTAWALAADAPEDMLACLVIQHAASHVYDVFRPRGTVGLANLLNWVYLESIRTVPTVQMYLALAKRRRTMAKALEHLPVTEMDSVATGKPYTFLQQVLQNPNPDSTLWAATNHAETIEKVNAPMHLIGGWHDFFLDPLLDDYQKLVIAGKKPTLTIGDWPHSPKLDALKISYKETISWFRASTGRNKEIVRSKPIRVQLVGTKEWREFDKWPPFSHNTKLYLNDNNQLSVSPPANSESLSRYTYDPADPTPSVGGALLYDSIGQLDNTKLESRSDVLTFTTEPLKQHIEVFGEPWVRLFVRTSATTTDFFVRLCDVTPEGKSMNITDGVVRYPACTYETLSNGRRAIDIKMSATACRFEVGHRIRLQVSSGAHPRYGRNLGVDDPSAQLSDACVAFQEVFHNKEHSSMLSIPF